ncbi:hypothetical protein JCM10213_000609 [Rhodosporidiobolus nylandii]
MPKSSSHTGATEQHTLHVEGERILERDEHGTVVAEKDFTRTVQAYERAANNKHTSKEKKEEDLHIVRDLKAAHDDGASVDVQITVPATRTFSSDSKARYKNETHEEQVHRHRQIGSLRGQLRREGVSDEARERIREELREMGEDVDE